MHPVDWAIVVALLVALLAGALSAQRYSKNVAAFLAAQRCGGRYLISVAMGMAMMGVISLVGYLEQYYDVAYNAIWWGFMEGPVLILMAITGWVYYRFRQTRALTLAQFFEIRYSRRFRIFTGLVAFISGIINFGIFPSVGARFFIWYCGIPELLTIGQWEISAFVAIMVFLLSVSLLFTFLGGQIAVMVTDFIQGTFAYLVFIIVIVFLYHTFRWEQVAETLLATEPGNSLVNPFDLGKEKNFDVWFYLISVVIMFYCAMGWQGTAGYNSCAKSPHESKMAMMLSHWRYRVLMLVVLLLPICVRTYLTHADFADESAALKAKIAAVVPSDLVDPEHEASADEKNRIESLRSQARAPLFMGHLFPRVLMGLMCAAMLGAFISTNDTYLHSWGSMLIQDVILPFRKKPLGQRQHLWLLRGAIFMVAIFIFFFSLVFQHTQRIQMYCALSANIFVSGAGAAIIGGLYWKRGTTAAAWTGMTSGMVLTLMGIWIKLRGGDILAGIDNETVAAILKPVFELTGQEMSFWIIVVVIVSYLGVSLVSRRTEFNMDRMLHRGEYAIEGETTLSLKDQRTILERLGWTKEFTPSDKIVAWITLGWPLVWFAIFIVGNTWHLLRDGGLPPESWLQFWHYWTWFVFASSVAVTVWFIVGGAQDLVYMYRKLGAMATDETDDGRVVDHQDAGGSPPPDEGRGEPPIE